VYLDGIVVADATDAGKNAPGINYLYADHLGTLRAVVTTAGTTTYTWPWLNNAFGEQPQGGTVAFYTRFPGHYFDMESGMNFNNNRFYDSGRGRYVEIDPLGLFGGQSSAYAYAHEDPINNTDPLGLESPEYSIGQTPGDFTPGNEPIAYSYNTACKRNALKEFLINMTPFIGAVHSLYELAKGDGGPGEVIDSTGSTADQVAEAAERAATSNSAQAAALRGAGMYNARQRLLNKTASADRSLGRGFQVLGGHS
jgi:RHS repeat-associated protein